MLPERENCHNFFQVCKKFLDVLTDENVSNFKIPKKYLEWEISLLAEVGISLNFTQCVVKLHKFRLNCRLNLNDDFKNLYFESTLTT